MADEVDTLQKAKELPCEFNNWAYFIKDASNRSISLTRRRWRVFCNDKKQGRPEKTVLPLSLSKKAKSARIREGR